MIKLMLYHCILLLMALIAAIPVVGQDDKKLGVSIEIRPRAEFRNGSLTLRSMGAEPAFFVSQRSRISADYNHNQLSIGIGVQNIRVWGASPQIAPNEGNNTMIHEAWAAFQLNNDLTIKIGRQPLIYDDDRILGSLDWHQAGRWHDVALLKYEPVSWKIHFGAAYNQDLERIQNNFYSSPRNNYKTLQMLWIGHQLNDNGKFSFLFLNTGFENPADSSQQFLQTLGGNFYWVNTPLDITASFYYQFGRNISGIEVNAFLASMYGKLALNYDHTLLFGTDYLSGENMRDDADQEITAFDPLYGTHHKFYGYMDYFYVGNPHQNVGLWDKYLGILTKLSDDFSLQLTTHHFNSGADVIPLNETEPVDTYLGTEVDLTFKWSIAPAVSLVGGYSQMFATESMEILKVGDHEAMQNWVWAMLTVNPEVF